MLSFEINLHAATKELTRNLTRIAERQIPFATVQALNAVAEQVKQAEKENIKATFPTATPFTVNSVVVLRARKSSPRAVVLIKDTAAKYLQPYEGGGVHYLNSRALLNPKNVRLNQYGNLTKGKLSGLKGRSDVFIGSIHGKSGPVNGVWQRLAGGKLKLLIRFGDALPVKERLNYQQTGVKVVSSIYAREFNKALAAALATAKP